MTITIPRKNYADIPETVFLGVENPSKPSSLDRLLHYMTPLFVYTGQEGRDWVRWSMPREVAQRYGFGDFHCACCPPDKESTAVGTVDAFHVDTAWEEVGPWLRRHDYRRGVMPT